MKKIGILIFFSAFLLSCKSTYVIPVFSEFTIPLAPDYNKEENWAVLPGTYSKELKQFSSTQIDP